MTDSSCDLFETPVGDCFVVLRTPARGPVALRTLALGVTSFEHELEEHVRAFGDLPAHDAQACQDLRVQIEEYFEGARIVFDIDVDTSGMSEFTARVMSEIREVPFGETASYGDIAIAAGRPGAARAVGTICRRTPISLVVPVHRIVRSDGAATGFGTHPSLREELLHHERVHRPFLSLD